MKPSDKFKEEATQKALILCDNFFKAATGEQDAPDAKQHAFFKILNAYNKEHPDSQLEVVTGNKTEFIRQHTAQFKETIKDYGGGCLDFCKLKKNTNTDEAAKIMIFYVFDALIEHAEKENIEAPGLLKFHTEFKEFLEK